VVWLDRALRRREAPWVERIPEALWPAFDGGAEDQSVLRDWALAHEHQALLRWLRA
jgi:hypothetical protein